MIFDPSEDFARITDGLQVVTLEVSGLSTITIQNAHRNQITTKEIEASGGDAKHGDVVWQWPVTETPAQPALGSIIVECDGSPRWTILAIDQQVMGSKWSAMCRDLAVEARLDTLVTIQQATYTKDVSGEAIPSWSDTYTAVRAKVQPIDQTTEVEHDRDETDAGFRIILESDLSIDTVGADWRVVDSNNRIYQIETYEQADRIDVLPALVCQRVGTVTSSSSSSSSSSGA